MAAAQSRRPKHLQNPRALIKASAQRKGEKQHTAGCCAHTHKEAAAPKPRRPEAAAARGGVQSAGCTLQLSAAAPFWRLVPERAPRRAAAVDCSPGLLRFCVVFVIRAAHPASWSLFGAQADRASPRRRPAAARPRRAREQRAAGPATPGDGGGRVGGVGGAGGVDSAGGGRGARRRPLPRPPLQLDAIHRGPAGRRRGRGGHLRQHHAHRHAARLRLPGPELRLGPGQHARRHRRRPGAVRAARR